MFHLSNLDYFKDKIQGLTTSLTTHMTSQEATSSGIPVEAEIAVWAWWILITSVILLVISIFALLLWRRRVTRKRQNKTRQNGTSVIFL